MYTDQNENGEFAVVLLDDQGRIIDAHPSCTEAFGWRESELVGKDVEELLEYGRDLLMQQVALLHAAESEACGQTSFSIRVMARRKNRTPFRARVTVRRFPSADCWTAAFYRMDTYSDESVTPLVRMEEILLATHRRAIRPSVSFSVVG